MQATILWREHSSAHESYSEYVLELEFTTNPAGDVVNGFKVTGVESLTVYPCRSKYGYEAKLVHDKPAALKDLVSLCNAMLLKDARAAAELILAARANELAAA